MRLGWGRPALGPDLLTGSVMGSRSPLLPAVRENLRLSVLISFLLVLPLASMALTLRTLPGRRGEGQDGVSPPASRHRWALVLVHGRSTPREHVPHPESLPSGAGCGGRGRARPGPVVASQADAAPTVARLPQAAPAPTPGLAVSLAVFLPFHGRWQGGSGLEPTFPRAVALLAGGAGIRSCLQSPNSRALRGKAASGGACPGRLSNPGGRCRTSDLYKQSHKKAASFSGKPPPGGRVSRP